MPDPAEQLARLHQQGFEFQTFERYPKAVGVIREQCIALLEATPQGLRMVGLPGWRMGEVIGVLVEQQGRQVFQAKSEVLEATPERLEKLRSFRSALEQVLSPPQ
ncbi:MAG: hypothetical protein L0Z53_07230 [Acidobacteriales bacterium]|nr:hypothetical protein [Terriglobales bacterium]